MRKISSNADKLLIMILSLVNEGKAEIDFPSFDLSVDECHYVLFKTQSKLSDEDISGAISYAIDNGYLVQTYVGDSRTSCTFTHKGAARARMLKNIF